MKRNAFLKGLGLAGVGLTLQRTTASTLPIIEQKKSENDVCVLIPSETAGPFPLDLSANTFYFRQDPREDKTGVQLNLKLKIIGLANCLPMQNVRVNIWHCDKDGNYSGYGTLAGTTFLRGYQITNDEGEVDFLTVFPGWYNGRICHIHFQVYVSSTYAAISQLTFDLDTKNALYTTNSGLYTKGIDPLNFNTDNIFSDGHQYQLATLTENADGSYDSYLEVTVQGTGTVGVSNLEKETAKQFEMGQNFPNPYRIKSTIPFTLHKDADVVLEIWDLSGKKVAILPQGKLFAGKHEVTLNMDELGLAHCTYAYQLNINNQEGTFTNCKIMTAT